MSIWPKVFRVVETSFSIAGMEPASDCRVRMRLLSVLSFLLSSSAEEASLAYVATMLAPWACRDSLIAAPMPFVPPVMMTTFPVRDMVGSNRLRYPSSRQSLMLEFFETSRDSISFVCCNYCAG